MLASAEPVEINGIYFNLATKTQTAEVTSNPNKYSGSVVIPKTIQYNKIEYAVVAIGKEAFCKCLNLTSVDIPNSVTLIGEDAFTDCNGLTNIDIPNSVTTISYYAFTRCKGLVSIILPNSVTKVAMGAFDGCSNLTSVTLPDKLATISNIVFNGCVSLSSITIPASVTTIETIAFHGCKSLTSIIIPKSVTKIGENSFLNCSGLTTIIVEDGNPVYDSRNNCNAIIRTEDNKLIAGCYNTQIPNTVTSIGSCAFNGFSNLTSMTIPNNVTSIEGNAFSGCSGMTSLKVESGNKKYDSRNNCNAIIETESNTLIIGCKNTVIPSSVTSIGNSAFFSCRGLNTITIPNSVTSIGGSAFYGCTSLTSIAIPDNVTSIGDGAFFGCNSLHSITIPASLTSIGMSVFSNCIGLANFYCLAENPPSSDTYSFSLTPLENVTLHVPAGSVDVYNAVEPWKNFKEIEAIAEIEEIDGICYKLYSTKNTAEVIRKKYAGIIKVPSTVTYDGIVYTVTRIGDDAFNGSNGLISVTIPNSVTSIGFRAFEYCSALTSITIPNSVKRIESYAFYYCTGLTSVTFPSSLEYIAQRAFGKCYELVDVFCKAVKISSNRNEEGLYTDVWAFEDNGLEEDIKKHITLHVPAASIKTYNTVKPWMYFKEIVALTDGDIPETSPKCAKPEISYANGKITLSCETEGVDFISKVLVEDAKDYNDAEFTLSQTYKISAYATKEGYEDSDIVTREIFIGNDQSILFGDLNKDGKVNVADHVKLSEIIMNK